MAVDKSGLLWVGTNDGLNVYDGYSVINYFKEQEAGMLFNNIDYLLCDEQNKMWVATQQGVSWIDDARKFHRVILDDSITRYSCLTIRETKVYGPILYTDQGQYYK